MAGIQDFQGYEDDFFGTSVTFPEAANIGTPWLVARTGAAPPTHVRNGSNAVLSLTSTSQEQILSLHHGNALSFDIDDILNVEMRVRIGAATFTSGSILVFGVGSARNDTADSVTANAWFRMVGATSTTQVYVETDDDVRDNNMIATGQTLGTTFKVFKIDFSNKADVKFYIDGIRVAASRTFDMSAYSAGLQPIIQLQKGVNTNADVATIDYVKINARRS
jgi:hypothetical protein